GQRGYAGRMPGRSPRCAGVLGSGRPAAGAYVARHRSHQPQWAQDFAKAQSRLMPPFGPITRRKLIRALSDAGFAGPFPGSDHEVMSKGELKVTIPNPHRGDIRRTLLAKILREAGISRR